MRRMLLACLVVSLSAFAFTPAHAARDVQATILLPTAATGLQGAGGCPDAPGCYKTQVSRHVRCVYLADPTVNQDDTTGRLGFVVTINPNEGGRPFSLTDETGLPAEIDFDIAFYDDLGTCEGETALGGENPAPDEPVSHGRIGADSGTIPAGTKFAIVTMFGGLNGSFKLAIS